MPRKKKYAVRKGHGAICLICGREAGKGWSLSNHVLQTHHVDYANGYKRSFFGGDVVVNEWKHDKTGDYLVHTRLVKVPKQK
jgi:hypothetical protein